MSTNRTVEDYRLDSLLFVLYRQLASVLTTHRRVQYTQDISDLPTPRQTERHVCVRVSSTLLHCYITVHTIIRTQTISEIELLLHSW